MNLGVKEKPIDFTKGDTARFYFDIEDYTSGDMTSATFTCKKNLDDETNSFQKTLNNGIEETSVSGRFSVTIDPADTSSLSKGIYFYALRIVLDGDTKTVMKGPLELTWEV